MPSSAACTDIVHKTSPSATLTDGHTLLLTVKTLISFWKRRNHKCESFSLAIGACAFLKGNSTNDSEPDAQLGAVVPVVVDEGLAVAAEGLHVHEAAGAWRDGISYRVGKIQLQAALSRLAVAQCRARDPAVLLAVAEVPVHVAPVVGHVLVVLRAREIQPELGAEQQVALVESLHPARVDHQVVDAARLGAI